MAEEPRVGGGPDRNDRYKVSGRNHLYYLPYYQRGLASFAIGRRREAIRWFDQAETRWRQRSDLYESLEPYRRAIAAMRQADEAIGRTAARLRGRPGDERDPDELALQQVQLTRLIGAVRLWTYRLGTRDLEVPAAGSRRKIERLTERIESLASRAPPAADRSENPPTSALAAAVTRPSFAARSEGGGPRPRPAVWRRSASVGPEAQDHGALDARSRARKLGPDGFSDTQRVLVRRFYRRKSALLVSPVRYEDEFYGAQCGPGEDCPASAFAKAVAERFQGLRKALVDLGFKESDVVQTGEGLTRDELWKEIISFIDERAPIESRPNLERARPVKQLIMVVFAGHACRVPSAEGGLQLGFATSHSPACDAGQDEELRESSIGARDLAHLAHRPNSHIFVLMEGCGTGLLVFDLHDEGLMAMGYPTVSVHVGLNYPMLAFVGTGIGDFDAPVLASLHGVKALADGLRGCEKLELTQGSDVVSYLRSRTNAAHVFKHFPENLQEAWGRGDFALNTEYRCEEDANAREP